MTAALIEGTPPPIPAERARSLNRWNLVLAALHAVQAVVIPIADRHIEAANELATELRERGLRVEVDAEKGSAPARLAEFHIQVHTVPLEERHRQGVL